VARSVHGGLARIFAALLALVTAQAVFAAPLAAQAETRVTIRAIDQQSKRGVALARVIVSGPQQRIAYTDATGTVAFDALEPGSYRFTIAAPAYQLGRGAFEIRAGETVAVEAGIVSTKLPKVIGSVSVRSAPASGAADLGAGGPVRKTNDTLTDALRFDPNAFVGPDGGVSINGQPPSATAYTLDGIPLGGGTFDASRINADLFSSVSVSQEPQNGATGGSVDLRSFEPTIAFRSLIGARYASNEDSSLNGMVTGTSGNVGFVLSGAAQGRNGALAGQRFLDQSGLDYVHGDAAYSNGLLAKVRAGLAATQSVSVTALRSGSRGDLTCDAFGALLPCGFGPGTATHSSLALAGMTYAGVFDRLSVSLVPYVRAERYDEDLSARTSFGAADPASSAVATTTRGLRALASYEASGFAQYELSASLSRQRFVSDASEDGVTASTSLDRRFDDVALAARLRLSRALSLRPALRYTRVDDRAFATGDVSATWTPASADTYSLAYSPKRYGVGTAFRGAISAPAALQFDCAGGDALANGGGDAASDPSTTQLRASWQHRGKLARTIVSAYRSRQLDALVPAFVNGAAFAADAFPPGFGGGASAAYGLACGGAQPFALADVLVAQPVRVPVETTMGFSAAASVRLGPSLVVVPAYTATIAHADALDGRFGVPRSVLVAGAQLPGVPMHRWSLVADYKPARGGPEAILTLQHVGENNPNRLPAYTLAGAGLAVPLAHGNLVVSATNLTDRFAGAFASPQNAVPLATNAGAPFALLARPLPARRVTIAYATEVGRAFGPRAGATTSGLPDEAERNSVRRFDIESLPDATPKREDALRTDPAAQSCVPEALRDAEPLVRDLRAYADRLDAASDRTSVAAPRIPGITLAYHPLGTTYELLLNADRRASLALGRCGHFSYASAEEAAKLQLGERGDLKSWQLDFRYMPRFGLFLVERSGTLTTRARAANRPLPDAAPAAPFAALAGGTCAANERPAVQALLAALMPALTGANAAPSDLFAIAAHGEGEARWYAVKLTDPLLVAPFLDCVPLASASRDELRRRGIDGEPVPVLNYAPRYGWYVLR
jgi:hypothetical protein